MNWAITAACTFSGQQARFSRTSPVYSACLVRESSQQAVYFLYTLESSLWNLGCFTPAETVSRRTVVALTLQQRSPIT